MLTKIAVLVSGGGTNLQKIIDAAADGKIPDGELALVVSSKPDAYALQRAVAAAIPTVTVERRACATPEQFEQGIIAALEQHGIELIVLAGFLSILSADFTKKYAERIINVHPSLIPSFCGKGFYGLRVHQAALDYGVRVSGATVHLVNEVCDGGRILLQKAVEVKPDDTPELLQRRIMEQAEWVLLPQAVEMMAREIRNGKDGNK